MEYWRSDIPTRTTRPTSSTPTCGLGLQRPACWRRLPGKAHTPGRQSRKCALAGMLRPAVAKKGTRPRARVLCRSKGQRQGRWRGLCPRRTASRIPSRKWPCVGWPGIARSACSCRAALVSSCPGRRTRCTRRTSPVPCLAPSLLRIPACSCSPCRSRWAAVRGDTAHRRRRDRPSTAKSCAYRRT